MLYRHRLQHTNKIRLGSWYNYTEFTTNGDQITVKCCGQYLYVNSNPLKICEVYVYQTIQKVMRLNIKQIQVG